MKVNEAISRLRNLIKVVREDAFITDRFIYSMIMKVSKPLLRKEALNVNIYKNSALFKEIHYLELVDVSPIESKCFDFDSHCIIKRSRVKLPKITNVDLGPIIRYVGSLDMSVALTRTSLLEYKNKTRMSTFKYNKTRYYWIADDYLYIQGVDWEACRLEAMFEESFDDGRCSDTEDSPQCKPEQEREMSVPDYMLDEIEQKVFTEIVTANKILSINPINDRQTDIIKNII